MTEQTHSMTKARALLATLRKVLQYDRRDLDFGIYRVLNQRRDEIDRFLEEELLPSIEEAFLAQSSARSVLESDLAHAEAQARELGVEPDEAPAVLELRAKLADVPPSSALADQVCSDLRRFFERYYDNGDFLSLRRYRAGTYAVPYEGEEVLLHWANKDQYYVKSSPSLSSLVFALPDERRVRLQVVASEELAGDVKPAPGEERRFVLAPDAIDASDPDELQIRFVYAKAEKGTKQSDHNATSVEEILALQGAASWHAALAGNPDGPLAKNLGLFTARNTHDYFIHQDLGSFLRRELDFFVKNEIVRIDELDIASDDETATALTRVRVLRKIASQVIDFLHQVEEFQKRVWLKRKLVLETSWLVTLDRVPEELYLEIAGNEAQREAWVDLLAIDQITEATTDGPGYSKPLEVGFLKRFPHLVIDTRNFPAAFVDRLLAAFDDLDGATTGVLVHSENFQALSLLEPRYGGEVSCIYIDPPYNTGGDGFLYKDNYQHSSWLTMMRDRLAAGRALMRDDSAIFVSIDDDEQPRLRLALDEVFSPDDFVASIIWQKKYTRANDARWFSDNHDYLLCYARQRERFTINQLPRSDEQIAAYSNPDSHPKGKWKATPLHAKSGVNNDPYTFANGVVWTPPVGTFRRFNDDSMKRMEDANEIWFGKDGKQVPQRKSFLCDVKAGVTPLTIWPYDEVGHNHEANNELKQLGMAGAFSNPKPTRLMDRVITLAGGQSPSGVLLDFFAGSGTLGQAALGHGQEGGTKPHRFVLVESGEHFESALRPRIVKSIHSTQWDKGCPAREKGVSSLVQCVRLESYEDALDALELRRSDAQGELLAGGGAFRADYLLRYMLDTEGRRALLDPRVFESPFAVTARATVNGEQTTSAVDLVATFNWLLGLRVLRTRALDGVRVVRGIGMDGRRTLVLWRTLADMPNETFDTWFAELDVAVDGGPPDVIYVNGDSTLAMHRPDDEVWEVKLLEAEFERLMFAVADSQRAA